MKLKFSSVVAGLLLSLFAINGFAQDDIVSTVQTGCETEIKNFCSQVSLGEGRLLACFYAHEDKLSGQCEFALYSAAAQLEHAVSALNYVAGQCIDDIEEHCASVQAGEGRILECLESQGEKISSACTQAINDVIE
jgi:Cysteine rich repeat